MSKNQFYATKIVLFENIMPFFTDFLIKCRLVALSYRMAIGTVHCLIIVLLIIFVNTLHNIAKEVLSLQNHSLGLTGFDSGQKW